MNAGFSNLATLKAYLLAPSLLARTDYDAALLAIGLGVAAGFEKFTGRKFMRAAGITENFAADRCQFIVTRYPIEAVTLTEIKQNESDGYVAQAASPIVTIDNDAGIIYLPDGADAGRYTSRLRFTFTGGYFWNQLEPADGGYPTALPAGAAALPDDLKLAWLDQCAEQWKKKDKLGKGITKEDESTVRINPANLAESFLPTVKTTLNGYIRYQLT